MNVCVEGVSVCVCGGGKCVWRGVNVCVEGGECVCVCGGG